MRPAPRGPDPQGGSRRADRRRRGAGAALALGATLAFALARLLAPESAGEGLERRLLDLRFQLRGPWPTAPAATVVAVDEAALAEHAGAPALRAALARAAPLILAREPAALALDLMLVEETPADPALAAALAGDPRSLIGAAGLNSAPEPDGALDPDLAAALDRSAFPAAVVRGRRPETAFLLPTVVVARAARIGHVNLVRDPDRAAREAPMALRGPGGRMIPSLALAAAATAEGAAPRLFSGERVEMGGRILPLDARDRVVIDHPGGAGAVATVSLGEVLAGRAPEGAFRDRLVFVGGTAESLRDVFVTPFGPDMPGVEVLAGLAAGLREGRVIRRDAGAAAVSAALALALCAGCLGAARLRRAPAAAGAGLAVWAAGAGLAQAAFALRGVQLDATLMLAGLAAGSAAGAGRRWGEGRRAALALGRERANLARFVAPALADRLARVGPEGLGRRRHPAAVIFVDAVGFTTLAETADPERMADFLAVLHHAFEVESARHRGVVVDYQGDGALIVFGLPDPARDDAARALACAEALADGSALADWARLAERTAGETAGGTTEEAAGDGEDRAAARRTRAAAGPIPAPPRLRVSLHYGPVAAAVLGGRRHAVMTVAGDTVNLASRLQDTARGFGADLVVTREALAAAGGGDGLPVGYAFLARVPIRGRETRAEVWAPQAAAAHAPRPEGGAEAARRG